MTDTPVKPTVTQKYFQRFDIYQRIEHAVMLASFTLLAVTGLPQKFAQAAISQSVINLFGGIEAIRLIHRTTAIVLMVACIWHIMAVLYRIIVKRAKLSMLPLPGDFVHLYQDVMFYLGRRKHKAYYGRYSYAEKVEYFAFVWGTLVMVVTGFMMWNPIATTNVLPGESIPAAKAAHGGEALLAVLAIILWHFYHVHLRHLNKSMFTGKMSRAEMEHEHPAELAAIEAGKADRPVAPAAVQRRRRVFFPVAGVGLVVLSLGLLNFVTFEKTAIDTIPRETIQAFVPFTPTPTPTPTLTPTPTMTPTPSPTLRPGEVVEPVAGSEGWVGGIDQLVAKQCAACHVNSQLGGVSLKTYAEAMQGDERGPVIVPGEPDNSVLVKIQQTGNHPGQFTPDELARVMAWIKAGAPEQATGGVTAPVTAFAWQDGVDLLVADKCAACHVSSSLGGLSLKTYADALKGGKGGPAIVPGDPDQSILVQIQQAGKHAGLFAADELAKIIEWIKAGAPETASPIGPAATPGATPAATSGPTSTPGPTATPTPAPTLGPTPEPTLIPD